MTDPTASVNPEVPTYPEWKDKGTVLSAFFWGYIIPQVGAGYLSGRFGPKYFLLGAMASCGSLCIFIPLMAARFGSKGVMINRALQGLSQGFIFPSMHQTLSRWVPPDERSRLATIVYAAGPFGTVVAMLLTGIISESSYGWPMVFYLYGALSLGLSLLCFIFTYSTPGDHPRISESERSYIEHSLGQTDKETNKNRIIPWRSIITSLPMWAILISHCGQNWGFWTLMTEIPNYMAYVMNFNIKSNSILSALPYFVLWLLSFVMSFLSDFLIVKRVLSITSCRKLFNSIGLIIPAIALIFLGITPADEPTRAVILLVIAVGLNAGIFCGFNINHVDISPKNAGILMGITNCISNITGILAPLFVQFVVQNEEDPSLWKIVFFLAAAFYIVADLFYVIFASGEIQKWNDTEDKINKDP